MGKGPGSLSVRERGFLLVLAVLAVAVGMLQVTPTYVDVGLYTMAGLLTMLVASERLLFR